MSGNDAYEQLNRNIRDRTVRVPTKSETDLFRDGGIFPLISPKFKLDSGSKIFTIGSCFAREIEHVLLANGFSVPVLDFKIPMPEGERSQGHDLLNEYNAGTISQRLRSVAGAFSYPSAAGIEPDGDGYHDLFLDAQPTLPMSVIKGRREGINLLYKSVAGSDAVIITLGMVESWYDSSQGCYLNRAPSKRMVREQPGRFEFHRMDVDDVKELLGSAINALADLNLKKIIITVSPVPLQATFMPDNVVMANSYSKAILRIAADYFYQKSSIVDYFPSYEIVTSFGAAAFKDDNVHVRADVVAQVTDHMIRNYVVARP